MTLIKISSSARTSKIQVSRRLVDAIASEMWQLYGRKGTLNWTGVERHLQDLADRTRRRAWTLSDHLAR